MSNTISVLVNVDSLTTINTPNVRLMMVDDNPNDSGQGSGELTINAAVGDTINWYTDSIQPGWQILVTQFDFTSGTNPLGQGPEVIDGVWTGQVQQFANATYHFTFQIISSSGVAFGPFQWDPYINVVRPS